MADRPLTDLLELTSYQGMTDSEIETVLSFKIEEAVNAALHAQSTDALYARVDAVAAALAAAKSDADARFAAAIASSPVFRTVQDG